MVPNLIVLPLILASVIARGETTRSDPPSAAVERRAIEDAAIGSAQDPIDRVDQRLDAAAIAFREDLPARIRTRLSWTPLDPTLIINTEAVLTRIQTLIDDSLADLILSDGPGRDRRLARAAAIEAAAQILSVRLRRMSVLESTAAIQRIHQELDDAIERTSDLDGPTLLVLAIAAATANEESPARSASTLLVRAAAEPSGIDAIEFELMQRLNAAGGVDPGHRTAVAGAMIKEPRRPADRLLIAGILLESRLQSGRSISQANDLTLRDALAARDTDSADRPRLTRGLAMLAANTVDPSAPIESIPTLAALGLSIRGSTTGDTTTALRFAMRACETGIADIVAEGRLELANLLLRAGDSAGAMETMVLLCREAPSHPSAERGAAIAARLAASGSSDTDHAMVVERILEVMPDHPDRDVWMITVGDRALRNGDEDAARNAWSSIEDRSELGQKALVRLTGLRDPGIDDATMLRRLEAFDENISPDPANPLRLASDLARVRLLLRLDRVTSAAEIAAHWLEFEHIPTESRLDVATLFITVLQRAGREAETAIFLARLERIDPSLALRLAQRERKIAVSNVIAAIDGDDRATAARVARGMISITPGASVGSDWIEAEDSTAMLEWSWIFAAANRPEDALSLLKKILTDRPGTSDALMLQAFLQGGRLSTPEGSKRTPSASDLAEAAIRTLSRITAGTSRDELMWWRCEIERLEILYLLERSIDRIGSRIDRLRAERPDFGSEALRRRFDRLRAQVSGSTR